MPWVGQQDAFFSPVLFRSTVLTALSHYRIDYFFRSTALTTLLQYRADYWYSFYHRKTCLTSIPSSLSEKRACNCEGVSGWALIVKYPAYIYSKYCTLTTQSESIVGPTTT